MAHPSVTVIVPVFNGVRFLGRCMESLRRQRYVPLEIVVVDDGSTDETPRALAALGAEVRAVRQENRGPAAARNHGLRIARGDVIGFLDVDDVWPDTTLATQAGHLRDHPSVAIVQGRIQDASPNAPSGSTRAPYFNVNLGAFLFRRTVFDAIGGFDEALRFGEDVDLLIRAWEHGCAKTAIDAVAMIYHQHDGNMTNGVNRQLVFARLLKKHLDRRRAAGAVPSPQSSVAAYLGWDDGAAPGQQP